MARRARQLRLRECYEILHLEKGADLQAVKKAYRQRAFELHPDLNPGNPEAGRQFQLLNEAYVALSAMLKSSEGAQQASQKEQAKQEQKKTEKKEGQSRKAEADSEKAQQAYAEQDVLRDLLNDPFARRVFEDIYSELNKKQEQPRQERTAPPPHAAQRTERRETAGSRQQEQRPSQQARVAPLWDNNQDKGVSGRVKGWLRRQIDEEQVLVLPASARPGPGCKIRLQIRRGISDDVNAVEVTLPPDFQIGKPVRLRGLGKRVGPWQGDLYLTIHIS